MMSNYEILTKAIEKAIAGGWVPSDKGVFELFVESVRYLYGYDFIYRHDFAKALWGETWPSQNNNEDTSAPALTPWQHLLQQMVIADDPIQYLGEHI